jgi:sugar phosphate isomerase/epimerase
MSIKLGCFAVLPDKNNPGQFVDLERFARFAYELRLDVVDFHLNKAFLSKERDYLRRVKILCLKYGLPIGYLGSGGGFVGTEEELRERVDRAKADVEIAVFLGAPMIRLFGGHVPEGVADREPLWPPLIRCFQEVCDYAADKGVIVGLQNHDNRNMAATGDDVIRILRETDRENFTLILDTGQWLGSIGASPKGEFDPNVDIYGYIEQTAPYASYVRAKIYKVDSGREEWINYERVIKIMKGANFNGNMSITYEGQGLNQCDDAESITLAAKHLRELLEAHG